MQRVNLICVPYYEGPGDIKVLRVKKHPHVNILRPDRPLQVVEGRTSQHRAELAITWEHFPWGNTRELVVHVRGGERTPCLEIPIKGERRGYTQKEMSLPVLSTRVSLELTLFEDDGNIIAVGEKPLILSAILGCLRSQITRVAQLWREAEVWFDVQQVPEETKTLQLFFRVFGQETPQGEPCYWRGAGQYMFKTIPWIMTNGNGQPISMPATGEMTAILKAYDTEGTAVGEREERVALNRVEL